jgi:hypothetical protein
VSARIYIAVPVHNRLALAAACVPTIADGMATDDMLAIYDDGSEPSATFDGSKFTHIRHRLVCCTPSIGIEEQRRIHFKDFWAREEFTHLYLTDADAPHDPEWRARALALQAEHGGAPVCLYDTEAHARLPGNTIIDDPSSNVIWRRVAPGISYLLTQQHVERVMKALPHMPRWNFDWTIPALLGHRFAISRTSLVEHIGIGGLHHPADAGYDGGDRAKNPTSWLIAKRAEIVASLTK